MQYSWRPVFRFVPTDGIPDVIDVTARIGRPKSIDANHAPDVTPRLDVNRRGNARGQGFRPTCKMTFEIIETEKHADLVTIANRLMADAWAVYLSLDAGATYREVELTAKGYDGPDAIQGKTFAGAKYVLDMQAKDLLDVAPALGAGVW